MQALEELFGLLTLQKTMLESIYKLAEEEQRVIISGDSGRLEEVVKQKLKELSKLNAAERKRVALMPSISAEFGIPVSELTASAIAERLQPGEYERLVGLRSELNFLLSRHSQINKTNKELINTHIEYSNAMIELMVDSEDPLNNFYGGDGKETPDRKRSTGFFDGQI